MSLLFGLDTARHFEDGVIVRGVHVNEQTLKSSSTSQSSLLMKRDSTHSCSRYHRTPQSSQATKGVNEMHLFS